MSPHESARLVRGVVSPDPGGGGWVASGPSGGEEWHVTRGRMESAFPGDLVELEPLFRSRRGRMEAAVVRVLRRSAAPLIGVVAGRGDRVVVREGSWTREVRIAESGRFQPEDLVGVRIRAAPGGPPAAFVERVFGNREDLEAGTGAALHRHGIRSAFPRAVLEEAQRSPDPPDPAGREDFRGWTVFTMDPADARDHDDALSVSRLSGGDFEVGVHIADVAAHVPAGGPMDREASRRGTSVYLPGRVIPMLPETLSSGTCSLRPAEDRLVRSILLRVAADGEVRDARFAAAVIRSRARLSYEEGMALLAADSPAGAVPEAVRLLGSAAAALGAARRARGALDLEMPERELVLDGAGVPVDARLVPGNEAHRLVEECMLAANQAAAERLREQGIPALHRVHRAPAPERVERFRDLLAVFGERLGAPGAVPGPVHFANLLERVRNRREAPFLRRRLLRSLERAAYESRPLGHFALALHDYTHFTSPIRRYPDLIAHRALAGEAPVAGLEELALHASRTERAAEAAERMVVDLGIAALLEARLGEVFPARVAEVGRFGLRVEVEGFPAAGPVPMDTLIRDDFRFDRRSHSLRGRRTGIRFRIGDRVEAQLVRVERFTGALEFMLAA